MIGLEKLVEIPAAEKFMENAILKLAKRQNFPFGANGVTPNIIALGCVERKPGPRILTKQIVRGVKMNLSNAKITINRILDTKMLRIQACNYTAE